MVLEGEKVLHVISPSRWWPDKIVIVGISFWDVGGGGGGFPMVFHDLVLSWKIWTPL